MITRPFVMIIRACRASSLPLPTSAQTALWCVSLLRQCPPRARHPLFLPRRPTAARTQSKETEDWGKILGYITTITKSVTPETTEMPTADLKAANEAIKKKKEAGKAKLKALGKEIHTNAGKIINQSPKQTSVQEHSTALAIATVAAEKVHSVPAVIVIPMFDKTAKKGTFFAISTAFPAKFSFLDTDKSIITDEGVSCTFRRYSHFQTMADSFRKAIKDVKTLAIKYPYSTAFFNEAPKSVSVNDVSITSALHAIAIIIEGKGIKDNRHLYLSACLSKLNEAYAILSDVSAAQSPFRSAMTALVAVLDDFYYPILLKLSDDILGEKFPNSVSVAKTCTEKVSWVKLSYPSTSPVINNRECEQIAVFNPAQRDGGISKTQPPPVKNQYALDKGKFKNGKDFDLGVSAEDVKQYCFPSDSGQRLPQPRGSVKMTKKK
jgi:hypothetical protein